MTAILKSCREFFLVLRLQNRQAWHHKKAALAAVLTWALRILMTVLLYRGIYRILGQTAVHGITLDVMTSSMLLYAVFTGLGARSINKVIDTEYRSGAIEVWLNKPIPYLILKFAENIGKSVPAFTGIVLCAILVWAVRGLPTTDHAFIRLLAFAVLFVMGQAICYCLYGLVGLSAVWLQDSSAAYQLVDKLIMIFGGIYIPASFFPHGFRLLGESLPTGAATYMNQIFYPDFLANLPRFLLVQAGWTIILIMAIALVSRAVNRSLTVNGG